MKGPIVADPGFSIVGFREVHKNAHPTPRFIEEREPGDLRRARPARAESSPAVTRSAAWALEPRSIGHRCGVVRAMARERRTVPSSLWDDPAS